MTALRICETFPTIQGEGKYIGYPSFFVRTVGCNLRCAWEDESGLTLCDTPYTSFEPEKGEVHGVEDLAPEFRKSPGIKHLVITGGEPCIQKKGLVEYINAVRERYYGRGLDVITIETNGTVFLPSLTPEGIFLSFSPKLSSSYAAPALADLDLHRKNNNFIESIAQWIERDFDFQLKFVITKLEDFDEIESLLVDIDEIGGVGYIPRDQIWLMPQGIAGEQLKEKETSLVQECIRSGYNFSPRLHINIWGNKRGT